MHKYRRQAKYAAWYRDPNEESNLFGLRNPFSKYRPNPHGKSDIENGDRNPLRPTNTAPEDPRAENDRRNNIGADTSPHHAATFPDAVSNQKPYSAGDEVQIPSSSSPANSVRGIPEEHNEKAPEIRDGNHVYHDKPARTDTQGSLRQREPAKKQGKMARLMHRKSTDSAGKHEDEDDGKTKEHFTAMSQVRATLLNSWINLLLIASPVGIILHYTGQKAIAVFVVNFIAIIPLAAMLSYATEEIALRTGEVLGGLLNASFGNAVELIVSIIALAKDQVLIVQTSLIGSMLSNLLLVMGMCFFFGGINRMEQAFNLTVAQTAASLLFLAVSSLIIPTAFDEWANIGKSAGSSSTALSAGNPKPGVAAVSRGTAIMLLIVYGCYLFFQLKSHAKIYNTSGEKNEKRDVGNKFKNAIIPEKLRRRQVDDTARSTPEPEEDEPEKPQLSKLTAVLTLAGATVLVAINAECLVDSINSITCGGSISKTFVGLILLPIVGNAAEHATAVTVAVKDKMDLAIGVAVGSSMQIALLVLPFVVVLGWIMGKDNMTLFFDGFQIAILFVAVLLVNYLIQDGKSHWLEGVLLMTLYIIIAVAAWFYPTAPGLSDCPGQSS